MQVTKKGTMFIHADGRVTLGDWEFEHEGKRYRTKPGQWVNPEDLSDPVLRRAMDAMIVSTLQPWGKIIAEHRKPPPVEVFPHDVEQKARAILRRFST